MNREIKFRLWDLLDCKMWTDSDLEEHTLHSIRDWEGCLMQYTGLKDKNGKEIYEGDILSGYPHGNSIVKWDNEFACWVSDFDLIANEVKDMPERKVIGNIYENPELLTNN